MSTHDKQQETTFYEELQKRKEIDLRDNRGKRHDLAFVLVGVIIALLRNRDGKLSSIHRSMVNMHTSIIEVLGVDNQKVISRSQLPRILEKVNLKGFEELLFHHSEIKLSQDEKQWFAGDGKELRGSIQKGDKRGEALVQLVRHEDRAVLGQGYYNGTKESEKPCLQHLIEQSDAQSQKITADALHLHPSMTQTIEQGGGVFLIGLKENQKELLQDMKDHIECFKPVNEVLTIDKGHGRLERRQYYQYDISEEYFDPRWDASHFRTLIQVNRSRINLKTNEQSDELAFYISNGESQEDHGYFDAVRSHWSVEVSNHIRDVSLKEDLFKTKKSLLLAS